jgi:peptidoglycan/LPS O-acetylase OafA/YrhL
MACIPSGGRIDVMPGILRFFLSILVVFSHLSGDHGADHFGYFAVRAFFVLSGLILTKSLHETYSFEFYRFYINRLLRILPLYAVVCAMTFAAIAAMPDQAAEFMPRWAFRASAEEILQNFLLLPLASGELQLRFIEPAWSLAVELVMYYFLWLGMARSQKMAMLCLGFGGAYHVALLINGASFNDRYFSIASAFLSYAAGAMAYFHYDWLAKNVRLGAACAILWFCNTVFGYFVWGEHVLDFVFYANILLFTLAAPWLLELRLPERLREHDAILGHLSYPVFLVQWLGGFVGFLLLSHFEGRGVALFYVSLPFILAMAVPLWMLNEIVVEPARKSIRQPEYGERGLRGAKPFAEPAE